MNKHEEANLTKSANQSWDKQVKNGTEIVKIFQD